MEKRANANGFCFAKRIGQSSYFAVILRSREVAWAPIAAAWIEPHRDPRLEGRLVKHRRQGLLVGGLEVPVVPVHPLDGEFQDPFIVKAAPHGHLNGR